MRDDSSLMVRMTLVMVRAWLHTAVSHSRQLVGNSSEPETLMRPIHSILMAALIACGGSDDTRPADSRVALSASTGDSATSTSDAAAPFAFTAADLDALQRGFAREAELVRASADNASKAKTPAERGAATQAGFEDATIPEGAKAAGLDVERYRKVRSTVDDVLTQLSFQGKIDGPMKLDTTLASPEMKAKLAVDPFTKLVPASASALHARLDQVVAAWKAYKSLTAVNG